MYVKARCPVCSTDVFHDIRVKSFKYRQFEGDLQAYKYMVKNIEITDTLTEKDLIEDILKSLQKIIHDGIEVEVLAGILKENYGVTGACCRDLIERIKMELDMYCPDMKKLYYVESN